MASLDAEAAYLERLERLRSLQRYQSDLDGRLWEPAGRAPLEEHQCPPGGDWDVWLLSGGRGSGKTEAASRYVCKYLRGNPGFRARVIAPTNGDAIESCVTGPSGVLQMDPDAEWLPNAPGGARIRWENGSQLLLVGTPTPRDVERLRAAGNIHLDWWEEAGANPMLRQAWDQAQLGLRLGPHPHSIISTTPRPVSKLTEIKEHPRTVTSTASSADNPHLSKAWFKKLQDQYKGTRLERQEVYGEFIEEIVGALWTVDMMDTVHVYDLPEMSKICVGVDPSGGEGAGNDAQGIVVCGRGVDGRGYVLDDVTIKGSPLRWADAALKAYKQWEADELLWESNFGGDLVRANIESVARSHHGLMPKLTKVVASRGKRIRAEPVSALYEKGIVSHYALGGLGELEKEMVTWTDEADWSPNRLDAMVMCMTRLMVSGGGGSVSRWMVRS